MLSYKLSEILMYSKKIPEQLGLYFYLSLAAVFFLLFLPGKAFAAQAWVYWVTDGDTIKAVTEDMEICTIRIYGLDCPESGQPYGFRARLYAAKECLFRVVELERIERDEYGRTVAIVQKKQGSLEEKLLRAGLAWVYDHYCHKEVCTEYKDFEARARRNQKGLWEQEHPVEPWKWRHSER